MEDRKTDEEVARIEFERIYRYALENNPEFAEKRKYYFGIFFMGYMACANAVLKLHKDVKG